MCSKNLAKKKKEISGPDGFTSEFYQQWKKKTTLIIYIYFQKKEEKGTSLNYFIRSASPYVKTRQGHYKLRKLQIKISQEYRHKNS